MKTPQHDGPRTYYSIPVNNAALMKNASQGELKINTPSLAMYLVYATAALICKE